MSIIDNVQLKVCTSCWEFHNQYMNGADFNFARKMAVTDCRLCEQAMCLDCTASSAKELEADPLRFY